MHLQPCALRRSGRGPTANDRLEPESPPAFNFGSKRKRKRFAEIGWSRRRRYLAESDRITTFDRRCRGQIDTYAHDHGRILPLQQHSAQLCMLQQDIVRPLEHESGRIRQQGHQCLVNRQARHERERVSRRIIRAEGYDRGTHEVAMPVEPFAALATPSRILPFGNEPVAFGHPLPASEAVEQIGVGRARFRDCFDQFGNPGRCPIKVRGKAPKRPCPPDRSATVSANIPQAR